MLTNIILTILVFIGFCILIFYLICAYKQYIKQNYKTKNTIELFPKEDIYVKNVDEDKKFQISGNDRQNAEKWAATQRGSVRISCGAYFTSDEYEKYRERVLNNNLP